ncbi:hypothetical protein Btru_046625 [Bulinus truncatus]|nr:hypothetical protein Btru_046625 [Bulinus truncatus]
MTIQAMSVEWEQTRDRVLPGSVVITKRSAKNTKVFRFTGGLEGVAFDDGERYIIVTRSDISQRALPWTASITVTIPKGKFHLVARGENIQAGNRQVHIASAISYEDYPVNPGFNVFLNGWARHNDSKDFKCCFLHSFSNESLEQEVVMTEVASRTYNVYRQWIVDMQNAEFSCSVPTNGNASQFSYVTFVENSCRDVGDKVMRIEIPEAVPKSVGVCLKVTYGKVDPEKMVEWFEFMKLMKPRVSLSVCLCHPLDGKNRGFRHPRYSEQAFVDEVMAANDCKHRMSRFDYVVVMDIDEFIVPRGDLQSYYEIFKKTSMKFPKAGGYEIDSHVIMTSWGVSRKSPLHITRYVNRTSEANYDGKERNTRWAFQPSRTFYVRNNYVYTRKGYSIAVIPPDYYILFHYRTCKRQWSDTCYNSTRVRDEVMVKYESQMIQNIAKLPLNTLLYKNGPYAKNITDWSVHQLPR